ncbi:MAG: hypothetical protein HOP03_04560 [Lysobacter sp.]|nr:hypothetical protein [Lysobacter sp.]
MPLRRRIFVPLLSVQLLGMLAIVSVLAPVLAQEPAAKRTGEHRAVNTVPVELRPAVTRAEFIGRQMYLHDRAAWLATDAMRAEKRMRPLKKRLGGWVTEPSALGVRVIFFSNDDAPQRLYEIDVDERERLSDPVLESPEPLTADHLAQLRARAQAQQQSYLACAQQYNTVVLPAADGIHVYMMPGFVQNDVYPLGGYHLYRFDSSGRDILSSRKFTNGCLDLDESAAASKKSDDGFEPIGMMFSHLLDPQPTEVHVFISLYAKRPFAITTIDNDTLWMIERGRVGVIDSMASLKTGHGSSDASTLPAGAP